VNNGEPEFDKTIKAQQLDAPKGFDRAALGGRPRCVPAIANTWKPPAFPSAPAVPRGGEEALHLHLRLILCRAAVATASRTCPTTATSARLGNNLVAGLSNGSIWALIADRDTRSATASSSSINFAAGDGLHDRLVRVGLFFGTVGLTAATALAWARLGPRIARGHVGRGSST
jgi:hypothetical protein